MNKASRFLLALPLFGLFLFSIFGGMASFEYTGSPRLIWLGIYVVIGLGSLGLCARLLLPRGNGEG